ncbi:S41 family peptidase [Paracrocinitomix mangrovi]|uniref:S41 family peptidase n=1 Tax=Paracrocinitomix mangrovi TaxID=2862509 RepID=UPI001C8D5063|nr:S41 family peptidase [Paracrocinitomix mangrovi]UKN03793.1 S41 family peptidase [Paracrocinitomix mangrovi]
MKIQSVLIFASIVLLASCKKKIFEPEPLNNPEALFEELWGTFNTDYACFEERGVDWKEQYSIYRPQVTSNTTDQELFAIFKSMLGKLKDGHVQMATPLEENVFFADSLYDLMLEDDLFDLEIIKSNYLNNEYLENGYGGNTYGKIGDVGYLYIEYIGDNLLSINEVLDYFSSSQGLIVDLRHNYGGNFTYAFSEFGRFTNEERFVFRSKTKSGPGPDDYTDWYNWSVYPEGDFFDKPVVLLTDRYTGSAADRTTMLFKTLPNVTHVGDTTNGNYGTKIAKELINGWYYTLVTQKIEFMDGLSYEGIGMSPDIYSKNLLSEMQMGQDNTLETAISLF